LVIAQFQVTSLAQEKKKNYDGDREKTILGIFPHSEFMNFTI
jgi:hypothetical protein